MKRIFRFIKWLFCKETPNVEQTQVTIQDEVKQLQSIENSVKEIKVIHEEISNKLEVCTKRPKPLVIDPRLTISELKKWLVANGTLETKEMSRKERQYYAKKVFMLKNKKNMKIVFDKKAKSYKYYPNGL